MDCFFIALKCRVCVFFRTFRFSRFLHVSFFKSSTFRFAGFKYEVPYYTQSPLNLVGDRIDIMFVGINPKGGNKGVTNRTLDNFLAGNECWGQRFCGNKNVWKFTNGARFFMGYDASKHVDTIDNDHKVVWTNLTPFQSDKGFTDLKAELRDEGVKSTLELISILKREFGIRIA